MKKNILILNGAARKNGNTASLIQALSDGAASAGHKIQNFYLDDMNIHSCKGCLGADSNSKSPCTQKDDMDKIYVAFSECDVVVFASPVYFWTITGTLKNVADRLYAELECLGYKKFARECVLLMTADGADYSQAVTWYRTYEHNIGWKNRGEILGKRKEREAYRLGASL
ncbi:flavodoxin family protein [Eubacterium sp. MSJ-13]|uniref:flavodoxin family protein n=1 Tax=Eubacterium sp. MSJ-13 TaxID=2841513 RepID=UPI001C116167|nr:flavodoxin family protein [Eubacterium sp. MSJ-13]MBU5479107.1 flavodoxin family protein [Eubacterium sp. MSJ-13]